MAKLPEQDRADLHADFQRLSSRSREAIGLTKAELRDAVDAVDDWIDDNALSFNNALPVAAKAALTGKQKLRMLMSVMKRRFEVT